MHSQSTSFKKQIVLKMTDRASHPEATSPKKSKKGQFAVTYSYVKGQEKDKGVDSLLASVAAIEDLYIKNLNLLSVFECNREALCLHYTEEFDQLAAGYTDGSVRFFRSTNVDLLQTLTDEDILENPGPVTSIKHRPVSKNYPITNTVICTYANGCVKCWNYNFGQCLYTIREKRQTFGVAYHPRLPKFVTCGSDSKLYLYDEENRIQERIFSGSDNSGTLDGHTSRVFAACFNPRSNHELITGGWDDIVYFWDARQPFAVRHISGVHVCGDAIDINSRGTEILTCAWQTENPFQVWDYGSGNLIQNIQPDDHKSKLYCGRYVNRDYIVCGGTDDNIFRLLDARSYAELGVINKLPGAVYSISVGPLKKVKQPIMEATPQKRKGGRELPPPTTKSESATSLNPIPKLAFSSGKRIYQIEHNYS